ncbi:uncharacterized protein LOC127278853 [Leptopilina boulardi]|uniref:uncharacterized protein LOC127278853 n=1 Tax=Leptopilina boulardi TaxID=63433 RepID=UPI0021F59D12|nr:uncharacterized protein LOC127278853 [Leptopilina boulardi]
MEFFRKIMIDFSTNEAIDAIEFWDKAVEIVRFVETVLPRRMTGKMELLKFFLSNDNGRKIQCVIWGTEDINSLSKYITLNKILHIDGGCARVPTKQEFNKGNVSFELQFFSSSVITEVGTHLNEDNDPDQILEVGIDDIIHHENEMIKLFAYVKCNFVFQAVGINRNIGTYGCGSVTNGIHKLEVRIASFNNTLTCKKCDAIYITGKVRSQGSRFFLQLQSETDIEVVDVDPLPLQQIVTAVRELKQTNDGQMGKEDVD